MFYMFLIIIYKFDCYKKNWLKLKLLWIFKVVCPKNEKPLIGMGYGHIENNLKPFLINLEPIPLNPITTQNRA